MPLIISTGNRQVKDSTKKTYPKDWCTKLLHRNVLPSSCKIVTSRYLDDFRFHHKLLDCWHSVIKVGWRNIVIAQLKKYNVKPIFHQNAKYLASGAGVGQCPQRQTFALEIPTCWYLKCENLRYPTPNPRRQT